MKSGSWHGSPFFLYLLLSFKCRNRRIRLKRSLFMIQFLYTNIYGKVALNVHVHVCVSVLPESV